MSASPTILAVASPPGRSLRGIIRISGAMCFAMLEPHVMNVAFTRGTFRAQLRLSAFRHFSVWAFVFPAPYSYTGENSIELQLPGNPALLQRVIDHLLDSARQRTVDARRAEPGEFTARAYLNGRLSLTQAEGVAATIAAQSDAELAAARMLSAGRLGAFAHALADDLAAALALVEAGIDFTDQEDVVAIAPGDLHARLLDLRGRLHDQLAHAVGIEQLRAIPWVVLVGEPNAGKSALFNALLRHERAVVSNIAGTTRDVLPEPMMIDTDHGRAEVMLIDLAGLDQRDAGPMNLKMQSAARQAIDRAELRLLCVPCDTSESTDQPIHQSVSTNDRIIVRTKIDLAPAAARGLAQPRMSDGRKAITVSAHTGAGLDILRRAIADRLSHRAVSLAAGALALQPRHEQAMRSALANLDEATALVEPVRQARSLPNPELIASSLRAALDELASLAGDMTPDDILGRIFATFCVGK